MLPALSFALIGVLLIIMTVVSAALRRLPLTAAIVYLLFGYAAGMVGLYVANPFTSTALLRLLTEIAVIVSLFTAGLKLRLPLKDPQWRTPILLASSSMVLTILIVASVAHFGLGLSGPAALLLASILAPTDPVLASSVQVLGPEDCDRLRFSLTAEAGLNDGTAFPFVMLSLGLMGLRDIGPWGVGWITIDLFWAVIGGLAIGTVLGTRIGRLVGYLRARHRESESFDDFLALGLIALSYGIAGLLHASGFLAVFAAGLALRRREREETGELTPMTDESPPHTRTDTVSGHMALAVLEFNEHIERLGELIIVLLVGSMLSLFSLTAAGVLLMLSVLFLARPVSVFLGVPLRNEAHKPLLGWFGIRGIGSLYYLMYAIEQGIPNELAQTLSSLTLTVIMGSIFIHGLSGAPLMIRYERVTRRRRPRANAPS